MSTAIASDPPALSVIETAEALRVSETSVREAIRRGELRAVRFGRRLLIPRSAIQALLDPPATITPEQTTGRRRAAYDAR